MFSSGLTGTTGLTPKLKIAINGTSLARSNSTAMADVVSVSVTEDVDVPGMFALTLVNQDLISGKITWIDHALFEVGNEVEIWMGNGDQVDTLMVGEITGLEPEFKQDEVPTLVVRGHDLRHRLMRGHKTRSFTKMKDSEIASQIVREAGLTPTAKDTKVTLEYVLQHNQTDLDFLQSRARRIGYEVAIAGKTLSFQPYRHTESKVLSLTYKENLLSFSPRLSTMNQTASVEVRGWDAKQKQATVAQSKASEVQSDMGGKTNGPEKSQKVFGRSSHVIVTEPISSASEAQQVAKGQLETMALAYITGSGECQGNPQLRTGRVIEIVGLGQQFSGLYYVTSATHTHTKGEGYRTEFEVKRNAA